MPESNLPGSYLMLACTTSAWTPWGWPVLRSNPGVSGVPDTPALLLIGPTAADTHSRAASAQLQTHSLRTAPPQLLKTLSFFPAPLALLQPVRGRPRPPPPPPTHSPALKAAEGFSPLLDSDSYLPPLAQLSLMPHGSLLISFKACLETTSYSHTYLKKTESCHFP